MNLKQTVEALRRKVSQRGAPSPGQEPLWTLYRYKSEEDYRITQTKYNKEKLDKVWADPTSLSLVANKIVTTAVRTKSGFTGLCHGARNGFEQAFLGEKLDAEVLGTDISDTAADFPNSVVWDFHDVNPDWKSCFSFVYSNSLDQSADPSRALHTWFDQLVLGGLLIIEHSRYHEPSHSGRMDPFGAKTEVMPYLLSMAFGFAASIDSIPIQKDNKSVEATIFVVLKRESLATQKTSVLPGVNSWTFI